VLKITLGDSNELLVGVTSILANIIFTTTSGDCDLLGPPSWPPLIAFDAPLCSLVGGYSGRSPTAARGCLSTTLLEDRPNRLLARGVPGGDVKELLRGLQLFTAELVQQGSSGHARLECNVMLTS
jgi:hypothetical protein